MNPFESNFTNSDTDSKIEESSIKIWVESLGRKKNTYVDGWNIPEEQLKEHIKTIKKKIGCNGTIKEFPNETNTKYMKVLHFQGNHIKYINEYLIAHDIDPNNIHVKG